MQSIFRYPGGKTKKSIKEKILSRAPSFSTYRETFCGGGGIFFDIPPDKNRWINDINPGLMSVYTALRDDPNFISLCREISPHKKEEELPPPIYNVRLKAKFDELAEKRDALSYFFINRTVWAGRVNYSMKSRLYFSNPTGWNIVEKGLLEEARQLLQNVKITCGDYKDLFIPGEDVWIYCDPPYFVQTQTTRGSQLYENCFTEQDHIELFEVIRSSTHKILLSYDDHPFIRNLYKDFNLHTENWTYCGSSNSKKKIGNELIITNYSILE